MSAWRLGEEVEDVALLPVERGEEVLGHHQLGRADVRVLPATDAPRGLDLRQPGRLQAALGDQALRQLPVPRGPGGPCPPRREPLEEGHLVEGAAQAVDPPPGERRLHAVGPVDARGARALDWRTRALRLNGRDCARAQLRDADLIEPAPGLALRFRA